MSTNPANQFMRVTPRKILQHRGQFWTPDWIARPMARYVLGGSPSRVFDPAVGAGALLINAKRISDGDRVTVSGFEIHPEVLELAKQEGLTKTDLTRIKIGNYLSATSPVGYEEAIICNPPYIRHHRLDRSVKHELRSELERWLGVKLDGRLGLHAYFFLRSLQQLRKGGRLSYITSADLYEGKSSRAMWSAIASRFRIDGIATFESDATPFPGVDTNPVINFIAAEPPTPCYRYIRVHNPFCENIERVVADIRRPLSRHVIDGLSIQQRKISDHIEFGLARAKALNGGHTIPLGRFIKCIRGIGTGANAFFFLTEAQVEHLRLPKEFFERAVGRTRDIPDEEVTQKTLARLDHIGRPTWLLNVRGYSIQELPGPLQQYIEQGTKQRLMERPLLKQRRYWYWTEHRTPPPFFFAYLGRRHVRFIRNKAKAQALTGFLYVYPQSNYASAEAIEVLWQCMQDPRLLRHLDLVAKTYGGNALKVEPRSLERTPVPIEAVRPLLRLTKVPRETQLEADVLVSG